MVYNTTQHPTPPPHLHPSTATHFLNILYVYFGKGGGGGQREGRGATVHKRGRKYQRGYVIDCICSI